MTHDNYLAFDELVEWTPRAQEALELSMVDREWLVMLGELPPTTLRFLSSNRRQNWVGLRIRL